MSSVPIDHLYIVFSDGRVNIFGSKTSLIELAAALRTLATGEIWRLKLNVIRTPFDELTAGSLLCRKTTTPLHCIVASDEIRVSGNTDGLERFATSLDSIANTWEEGGHTHIFPGESEYVSKDSEEILIGGFGYLPNEMYGLRPDG